MMLSWLRKPRAWAWLVGIFGVLVVGMAGLTGVLLRQQLAPLQSSPLVFGSGLQLVVEDMQSGWFTTRATLRLEWQQSGERQLVVRLANDFAHGPFPRARLAMLDLRPAALADRVQLLSLEQVIGGQRQALLGEFSGDLRVSYFVRVQATLQATTDKLPLGAWQLAAEAMQLAIDADGDSLDLQIQAQTLHLQPVAAVAAHVLTLRTPRLALQAAGFAGLPHGSLALSSEQFDLLQGGVSVLRLRDLDQQARMDSDSSGTAMVMQASVRELALWGQPVGQLSQSLQAEGVGLSVLMQALGGQAQAWAAALPTESIVEGTLLALENADGSSFLRLDKASGLQPLQVSAELSKPMFLKAIERNPGLQQQGAAIAQQQALQLYGFVSQPLLQSGFFLSTDKGLQAALELDANGLRSTLPTTFLTVDALEN